MKISIIPLPTFQKLSRSGDWTGWLKADDRHHVLIQISGGATEEEAKAIFAHLAREP